MVIKSLGVINLLRVSKRRLNHFVSRKTRLVIGWRTLPPSVKLAQCRIKLLRELIHGVVLLPNR